MKQVQLDEQRHPELVSGSHPHEFISGSHSPELFFKIAFIKSGNEKLKQVQLDEQRHPEFISGSHPHELVSGSHLPELVTRTRKKNRSIA